MLELAQKAYAEKSGVLGGGLPGPMSDEDYAKLGPEEKSQLLSQYHKGLVRTCQPILMADLERAFNANVSLHKLVGLIGHMEEQFFADPAMQFARDKMAEEGKTFWVTCTSREGLTRGLRAFAAENEAYKPYLKAADCIEKDPKEHHMWIVVMAGGYVTVAAVQVTEPDPEAPAP